MEFPDPALLLEPARMVFEQIFRLIFEVIEIRI
jgi:hypothetical protein